MEKLNIIGLSHIILDLIDCATACGHQIEKIIVDQPLASAVRDIPWPERIEQLRRMGFDAPIEEIDAWAPAGPTFCLLGPTTPMRSRLVNLVEARHTGISWPCLIHPSAHVSRLSTLAEGCFVGAGSVIAAGVRLDRHVFVNRCASVGHDTEVKEYARLQPSSAIGGFVSVGRRATVGIGATVIERLRIGDGAFVAAGAVVTSDVGKNQLVAGAPAKIIKVLAR